MGQQDIEGFPPQSVFSVIGMRRLWDELYEEGNLVENLDNTTSLTYMVMHGMAGSKTRDFSLVEKVDCDSDGTIYFVSTSVITPKIPPCVGKVRANIKLNGWVLQPTSEDPSVTRVTYILQSDVRGWIPSVLARKYLARRPLVIHTIKTYLLKNGPPVM
ncbi:11947_t:CDS:2, partial [Acaulospora morrowiae]